MPVQLGHKTTNQPSAIEASDANGCYHCGEACDQEKITFDDKSFCCVGCKTVYELITHNELDTFYELTDQPGKTLRGKIKDDFAYLEDEEVIDKLVDFRDDDQLKISFHLPQIHCTSCIWLIENLHRIDQGVIESKVNFLRQEAYITINTHELSLRSLVEILDRIGYTPRLQLDKLTAEEGKGVEDRTFAYQIGVAGFAFGNIMLLSFPEYLGLKQLEFQQWFGYLNIALTLPVVLFSGRDYIRSAWQSLKQAKLNIDVPITLGIITLFARSVYEILSHTGAGYLDSLAGLVFFLLIGKWFQLRTYHHLSFDRDYKSYFPISVAVKEGNQFVSATLDKLKMGDIVQIQNGGLIPADGVIVAGQAELDYSFVTGESKLISKKEGEKVYAGGRQQGQNIEIALSKNVSQSYLTQLWNNDAFKKEYHSNSSALLERVGSYFTPTILLISLFTFLYWWPKDFSVALQSFTAVLIIACPCALSLSIPFTLGNAVRLLGKVGVYVKNTDVLETIASIDNIVFDKTGTLTYTKNTQNEFTANKADLSTAVKQQIKSLTQHSSHPVSQQINSLWPDVETVAIQDFKELTGKGVQAKIGDLDLRLGSAAFVAHPSAKTGTWAKIGEQYYGPFVYENHFREGLQPMFESLKADYDFFLLSGDKDDAKEAVSRFIALEHQHFDQSPHDKLAFIKQKQDAGGNLMMIGDGLNDAGALQQSEVGMVVTEDVNNFTPSCDIIMNSKQLAQLSTILSYVKKNIQLVYLALAMALVYNIIGLSFAVQGLLSPLIAAILMPLSSISIAVIGTVGSSWLSRKLKA